jgi:hypothetical protein
VLSTGIVILVLPINAGIHEHHFDNMSGKSVTEILAITCMQIIVLLKSIFY